MAFDPVSAGSVSLQEKAFLYYRVLELTATPPSPDNSTPEPNLGGKLLYAGELEGQGRAIVIAGNIAGCATLVATADSSTQKKSIREGIVDFLVNSLDEALRILKNEIRKHQPVAVCVGLAPVMVEREMIERGVLPDFVFAGLPGTEQDATQFGSGVCRLELKEPDRGLQFISWQATRSAGRWMPKLDAIVLESLGSDAWARRWIRLSSRYRGRSQMNQRVLYCDPGKATSIVNHITTAVREGRIETEILMCMNDEEGTRDFRIEPAARTQS